MSAVCKTVSGRLVDLVKPDWREIDLGDVARGLAQINRFGGQSRRAFSVAQHSLVVARLAYPSVKLAALLHDAHEAFLGDWTRPGMEALFFFEVHAEGALARVRRGLDVAIARRVLEDVQASRPHGIAIEATQLADEMAGPHVGRADDQALGLEDAIRGQDALQGASPDIERACELYGALAPSEGVVALEWLAAVREAAAERYGVEP